MELVSELLRQEFEIIARVADGEAALAASITLQPALVVSDISMPLMSGLELAGRLRALNHSARIVIMTMHEDAVLMRAARASGALGYVLKSRVHRELPLALRRALAGQPFVSPNLEVEEDADTLTCFRHLGPDQGELDH
jgi:DNA-binding NarL/FixJ family response regulator